MSDISNNSEGAVKSFAERYASKKSSFTSQALQKAQPKEVTEEVKGDSETESSSDKSESFANSFSSKNSLKQKQTIDPQKKMQAELIYLVKGVDAGRNAWYYVLVERLKVQLFLKALNDEIIHLENYGKILFSAYGDEPPAEITQKLKEEYGIN